MTEMRISLLVLASTLLLAAMAVWALTPQLTPVITRRGATLEIPPSSRRTHSLSLQKGEMASISIAPDGGPVDAHLAWVYYPMIGGGEGVTGWFIGKRIGSYHNVTGTLSIPIEADASGAYVLSIDNPDPGSVRLVRIEQSMVRSIGIEKTSTFLRDLSFLASGISALAGFGSKRPRR